METVMQADPIPPSGWLIAVDADCRPAVCAFVGKALMIGRAPGCAVVVPLATVSRRHALLMRRGGLVVVDDAQSVNGTYVNGRRIEGPQALCHEDLISLGADGPLFQFLAGSSA